VVLDHWRSCKCLLCPVRAGESGGIRTTGWAPTSRFQVSPHPFGSVSERHQREPPGARQRSDRGRQALDQPVRSADRWVRMHPHRQVSTMLTDATPPWQQRLALIGDVDCLSCRSCCHHASTARHPDVTTGHGDCGASISCLYHLWFRSPNVLATQHRIRDLRQVACVRPSARDQASGPLTCTKSMNLVTFPMTRTPAVGLGPST
jgi:hypothetical protein